MVTVCVFLLGFAPLGGQLRGWLAFLVGLGIGPAAVAYQMSRIPAELRSVTEPDSMLHSSCGVVLATNLAVLVLCWGALALLRYGKQLPGLRSRLEKGLNPANLILAAGNATTWTVLFALLEALD